MRILVVSNLFPPQVLGGAEIIAHRHARRLQTRGHVVSVFAGWVAPGDQSGRLEVEERDGLRVWRTPVVSFDPDDNFFAPAIAARLHAVLEAERPDLVHFHNLSGLGFSLVPLVKSNGLPAVVTLQDHAGYCYRATALRPDDTHCREVEECALACRSGVRPRGVGVALPMRLRRDYVAWALAHADRLITPSAALAAAFRAPGATHRAPLEIISQGIDLAAFRSLTRRADDGRVRFLCSAYLGEHKGIPDLLQAAAWLAAEPDLSGRWSLVIAGDGHLRTALEREIASGRLGDAVRYLGRVPRERIIAEMAATDVVVLPSRWSENEPVVLLEAIAAGVAQLATAVGGIPGLVQHEVTGQLVPPSDPQTLARAMAAYVREPGRARRHGDANLRRRERFSEEAAIDATEAVYAAVLQRRRPPTADRPLVLCAGDVPPPQVDEICKNLFRLEEPHPGVRLVWHGWADSETWERAALLWNWSSATTRAMQRALRAGVPILAPRSCAAAVAIADSFGAAVIYDTFLEAMVALARVPHDATALRVLRRNCREAGGILAASVVPEFYGLRGPDLS
jgi:glycosyltransferase involved in cell wall biosynthesis